LDVSERRCVVPWTIGVELINPKTGDKVGKRLDCVVNVSAEEIESWSPVILQKLESVVRALAERARDMEAKTPTE
jgi:hypothetical protein